MQYKVSSLTAWQDPLSARQAKKQKNKKAISLR